MSNNTEAKVMGGLNPIQVFAYDRFLLHWMATNGISLSNVCELAQAWAEVCAAEKVDPKEYPFVIALKDTGLNKFNATHLMWPTLEEFAEKEYLDAELMHALLSEDSFTCYMEEAFNIKMFRYGEGDADDPRRTNYVKYWCNACGELHHHGEYMIEESDLPEELATAYDRLWTDCHSSLCYLVETPSGYGVALINEYGCLEGEEFDERMKPYWAAICADAAKIAQHPEFKDAEIIVNEFGGCEDRHELIVIFPTSTAPEAFEEAVKLLDKLAFSSLK